MVRQLAETGDDEAGGQLAAELGGQRMAVLQRRVRPPEPFALAGVQIHRVAVGQRVPDDQLLPVLAGVGVEDVQVGVHEPGQEPAAGSQHPERLPPDRLDVRAEQVRHRVKHQVEAAVAEGAQVPHVAQHGRDGQPLAARDQFVLGQLPRRVVEYRHPRPGRGEHRALLAAAAGQAQHVQPGDIGREPVPRDRLVPDQHDRPLPGPGRRDDLGPDRYGPLVAAAVDLEVPGHPVVRYYRVHLVAHRGTVPGWPA